MADVVVIDTNLLVLLMVGSASRDYIRKHKRLTEFSTDDFELLVELIGQFSQIVLLPHILAEASSLARQIDNPARSRIQDALGTLIDTTAELPIPSIHGVQRSEFNELGLTDAMILHLCNLSGSGIDPTLITVDEALANNAHALGYSVIDYKREYKSG
ncbi:MAG: PIN domain-containing protein [Xanthobacteraceae bacterium]